MTAQIGDTLVLNQLVYQLAELEGSGLFNPDEHGFEPVGFCSACWRGFVCEYEVIDERLFLTRLSIGLSDADSEKPKLLEVFGKDCSIESSDWLGTSIT